MECRKGSRDCGDACSVRGEGWGCEGWRDMWSFTSSALHCSLCSGVMEEGSGGWREGGRELIEIYTTTCASVEKRCRL